MKQILVLLIVFASLWSCRTEIPIQYENTIETAPTFGLYGRILNNTFMFGGPMDIFLVDSLIIVNDFMGQEYAFHIFSKTTGIHVKDFGKRGRGPGELVSVSSAVVYNGSLVAYDANLKKMLIYNLKDVMSGEKVYDREYSLIGTTDNMVLQVIPAYNNFILAGNSDRMRFGIWELDEKFPESVYTEFPSFVTDDETNWSIANYAASMAFSPDNGKFVTGTYIGCTFEIFDVANTDISRDTVRYFYDFKETGYAAGAVPKWVVPDAKTVIGFQDMDLTPDVVYGLIWGVESEDMEKSGQKIIGFDYAGNPLFSYMMDDILISFDTDDIGNIYGIAVTPDFTDYCIKVYSINN